MLESSLSAQSNVEQFEHHHSDSSTPCLQPARLLRHVRAAMRRALAMKRPMGRLADRSERRCDCH